MAKQIELDLIDAYLERVWALNQRADSSAAEALAHEMGFERSQDPNEAELHSGLASEHFRRGDLELAALEYAEAAARSPLDTELLAAYARVCRDIGNRDGDRDWQRRAIHLSEQILRMEPNNQAAQMILDDRIIEGARVSPPLIMLGLALFAVSLFVAMFFDEGEPEPERERAEAVELQEPQAEPATEAGNRSRGEYDNIPLDYQELEGKPKLEVTIRQSQLTVYEDSAFYKLKVLFTNSSRKEIKRLDFWVESFDRAGKLIERNQHLGVTSTHPPLRPGDVFALGRTYRSQADLASYRISIATHEYSEDARGNAALDTEVALAWEVEKPSGTTLTVRERLHSLSLNQFAKKGAYFRTDFEIRNAGSNRFEQLKFRVDYFSASGDNVASEDLWVIASSDPDFMPGDARLAYDISEVPPSAERYTLTVVLCK